MSRFFNFPDDRKPSLIKTPPSVQAAIEKAPPAPTIPYDALSLYPDEASINAARAAGELSIQQLPAETIEFTAARPPSVSTPYTPPPHEAAGCSDEAVATAAEWISSGTVDASRLRVAAIREEVARIAGTVLALEARISRLTAKDQPLAVSMSNAPELERRSEEIAAHLQDSALAAEAQTADIAARLVQIGQIADRLSTLQAAVAELIEPNQPFTVSEARAELLERRGAEISAGLERTATIADRQATDIAGRVREADDLGERLAALEMRLATLRAPDQALARGAADMQALERRGAEISAGLERTATIADRQATDIAARLRAADDLGERLAAVETRLATLRAPDQTLARGEADMQALERRGADISAGLDRTATIADRQATDIAGRLRAADDLGERLAAVEMRLATLRAPDQALARGEADMQALERRGVAIVAQVEHITAQLERAASATDASKRETAACLLAVDEIGERLSTLETRICRAQDHQLATFAVGVQQLEQRSADIFAQFQRSTTVSDAQWTDIAQRAAQAADIGERVSRLETRISKLIGRGQVLEHAEGTVEQLEQRTRNAIDELERARQTQDDREREIARLEEQLTRLDESVPKDIGTAGTGGSRSGRREVTFGIVAGITAVGLTGILALRSPHAASEERNGASNRASIAVPVAVLPATPLPARISGIHVPPTASPPRLKVLAERRIASTEQRRSPEPVRAQKPLSGFERSSAVSVMNTPTSSPAFIGALDIESDPEGSTVFIDGKVVGETPVHVPDLRAGSHVVRIVRDGHRRWTASVSVPADKRTHIKATLAPESTR